MLLAFRKGFVCKRQFLGEFLDVCRGFHIKLKEVLLHVVLLFLLHLLHTLLDQAQRVSHHL